MKRPVASIAGTGRGMPARVMTNCDFAALGLDTSHDWIVERTGIVERRIAADTETTCSMAAEAARAAMARAGVQPGEIDAIVLSTATADRLLPSTAVDLQAELGATRAAAFDLSAACSGWIYGMTVAEGLIQSGVVETALVAGPVYRPRGRISRLCSLCSMTCAAQPAGSFMRWVWRCRCTRRSSS